MAREHDQCPACGLTYDAFRTGESFASVKASMWVDSDDSSTWRYRTRAMVLGVWHAMKVALFRSHVAECLHYARLEAEENAAQNPANGAPASACIN